MFRGDYNQATCTLKRNDSTEDGNMSTNRRKRKKNKKKDIREKKKPETQWASIYKSNCPSKNCTFNQTLSTLSLYLSFPLFFYIFPLLHRLNICQPKLFNRFNECLSFYFGRSLNKQFTKENNFFFLFLFID